MSWWARWSVVGALALGAGVGAVHVAGTRLPMEHRVTVTGVVRAPREEVWDLVTDTASQANWRHGLRRVMPSDIRTREECWVEIPVMGSRLWCAVEQQTMARRVVRVVFAVPPFDGTWTYEMGPSGEGGTRVTITEEDALARPIWRFVSRYLMKEDVAGYLRDLQVEAVRTR